MPPTAVSNQEHRMSHTFVFSLCILGAKGAEESNDEEMFLASHAHILVNSNFYSVVELSKEVELLETVRFTTKEE